MYDPLYDLRLVCYLSADCSFLGTKILKCVEGQFNKVFILTIDDVDEVIAKLPNPNAGPAFYTLSSEVATRDFVSDGKMRHVHW